MMALRRVFLASLLFAVVLILFWSLGGASNLRSPSILEVASPVDPVPSLASATTIPFSTGSLAAPVAALAETSPGAQPHKALAEFTSWTERYLAANAAQREALEEEGVKLATARRPWFKQLIQTDPRRALEQAVPRVVRQDLPQEVVAQLEKPVSAKGTTMCISADLPQACRCRRKG